MKKKLPEGLQILFEEGPSDESWKRFLSHFDDEEVEMVNLGFPIPEDILKLLLIELEEEWRVKRWIESKSDLFDGYSPKDLLDNYEGGGRVVRCILWRWPRW